MLDFYDIRRISCCLIFLCLLSSVIACYLQNLPFPFTYSYGAGKSPLLSTLVALNA